jgi:hypothetical protein
MPEILNPPWTQRGALESGTPRLSTDCYTGKGSFDGQALGRGVVALSSSVVLKGSDCGEQTAGFQQKKLHSLIYSPTRQMPDRRSRLLKKIDVTAQIKKEASLPFDENPTGCAECCNSNVHQVNEDIVPKLRF